jgi:hypothetical protein
MLSQQLPAENRKFCQERDNQKAENLKEPYRKK